MHGYNRMFTFWFAASRLDPHGFVVDFSSLGRLQLRLSEQFDHTFLVNADDPLVDEWKRLHQLGALDLRVMDNVSMEATARMVWGWANELLQEQEGERCCCWKTEARESDSNAACYEGIPGWYVC